MARVGGGALLAFGGFLGVGLLLNVSGPHSASALFLAFVVFSLVPAGAGLWLIRAPQATAASRLAAERAWNSELLRLAARRDGSLSVAEVVAHADLAPAEAEQRLDDLSRRGLCELQVTDHGVIVYRFAPTPNAEHKRTAQGVLDE